MTITNNIPSFSNEAIKSGLPAIFNEDQKITAEAIPIANAMDKLGIDHVNTSEPQIIVLRKPNPLLAPVTSETIEKLSKAGVNLSPLLAPSNTADSVDTRNAQNVGNVPNSESRSTIFADFMTAMIILLGEIKQAKRKDVAKMATLQDQAVQSGAESMIKAGQSMFAGNTAAAVFQLAGTASAFKMQNKASKLDNATLKKDEFNLTKQQDALNIATAKTNQFGPASSQRPDNNVMEAPHTPQTNPGAQTQQAQQAQQAHQAHLEEAALNMKTDIAAAKQDIEVKRNQANDMRNKANLISGLGHSVSSVVGGMGQLDRANNEAQQRLAESSAQSFASVTDGKKSDVSDVEALIQSLIQRMTDAAAGHQQTISKIISG